MSDESSYPLYPPSKLDQNQIIQGAYDEESQRLRTDAVVNIGDLTVSVELDPTEDGVFIADQQTGNKLKINADGSINIDYVQSTVPTIANLSLPSPATEYFIQFPIGTKKLLIKCRDNIAPLQIAFTAGTTNSDYLKIPRGCNYSESDINLTTISRTLYIQSNKPNVVLECLYWE